MEDKLTIAGRNFDSRLFLGTGKFGSNSAMARAIAASESQLVTVALKRVEFGEQAAEESLITGLKRCGVALLPNTAGARNAEEALLAAELGRDALETEWVKLEIHPDPRYLMPDPIETLAAAAELTRRGFVVLPYVHADPVLCLRLEEVGVPAVMPLGAPIGSNAGLQTRSMLEIIIDQASVPVIVDAGIGAPSHAAEAMELGADAVLVNTAIAVARDPVAMAQAFKLAVQAGRSARIAGLALRPSKNVPLAASASSPLTHFGIN